MALRRGHSRAWLLRCLAVRSVVALLLTGGQLCLRVGKVITTTPRAWTQGGRLLVRRRAAGFNYGESKGSGQGFGGNVEVNDPNRAKEVPQKASTGLVKDRREGKSKALSTSKLKDLRDRTLARRQKREAELDEYEEGRALIAKYGPKVSVMPEKVAQRAAKRGMVIGGSFYFVMILVFAAGIFVYKTQDLIIPPTLIAFITLALLALSVGGGSYGMMSASWDEDREGSVLGTEELSKNVDTVGEGFRRLSMQNEYEKALELRKERRKLLQAKEDKKRELLNK